MLKICKICGKEFEPKVYNATICYEEHTTNCKICGKEIKIDTKIRKKNYLENGYLYCSHNCACVDIGNKKVQNANNKVDLEKLKELYEHTSLPISQIAKELNTSVDFITSRITRLNLIRSETLKNDFQKIKNEKLSRTLKEKYKVDEVKNSMIQKARNTYKTKTGYTSNFLNPESIKKAKETKLKKYGNEQFTNPKKMKQTRILKNNGVFWSSQQTKQRIETTKERYGSENNFNKIKETKLEKYGNPYWCNPQKISLSWNSKSKELKDRIHKQIEETKLKRYNDKNYNNTEKVKQTCIERYGVDNIFKLPEIKERIVQINYERYGTMYPITLFSYLNGRTISKLNKQYLQQLTDLGLECSLEFVLQNNSYDILVKPNILLEINPSYTHNSTVGPYFKGAVGKPKDKDYHYNKTLTAKENNYHCIHIWDWDNKNKIINSLMNKEKIYARNCIIKVVSKEETDSFLNKFHYQNTCKGQDIRYGLYYNDELVEIMTFGKPRYNKKYEWELLRLCNKNSKKIIGGSEKLFKHFINEQHPKSVISYCDLSKFTGEVYNKLGFELLSISEPTKHWYNMKTKRHITDNLLRQRGFSQLHNDNKYELYKKGQSNEELMIDNGYVAIYDCGQATYSLILN